MGCQLGEIVAFEVRGGNEFVGIVVGQREGSKVGASDGVRELAKVGTRDGVREVVKVGTSEGVREVKAVGGSEGEREGLLVSGGGVGNLVSLGGLTFTVIFCFQIIRNHAKNG